MAEILRLDLSWRFLVEINDVLASRELLLPGLDLFLTRERICFHDSIYYCWKNARRLVNIFIAFVAVNSGAVIVSIGFGLCCDSDLGDLCWRFISNYDLSGPSNV